MLRKLMKYELKATGRIMLPLFLMLFVTTVVLALDLKIDQTRSTGSQVLLVILVILFIAAILLVSVVSLLLILGRFYKNLLGDEGYLMFSLPVSTAANIAGKGLTALIWIIGAVLTGTLSGICMMAILGDFSLITSGLHDAWTIFQSVYGTGKTVLYIVLFVLTIIFSMLEAVFKVYASMAVGHQWGEHRILGSLLGYIGFSILETVITALLNLSPGFSLIFMAESTERLSAQADLPFDLPAFAPLLVVSLIGLVVYGLITWVLLDRRLNLE